MFSNNAVRRIRRAAGTDDHSSTLVLQYVPSRPFLTVARKLRGAGHVYDRVLDWARVPANWYPPHDWHQTETLLESEAHLATDSAAMQRDWSTRGHDSILITPAADDEFLGHDWSPPPTHGPIGYFGTVQADIIDLPMLCAAAESREVEIVGDVDEASRVTLTEAGVKLHPAVRIDELPAIIENWSAILLPYRVGDRRDTLVPAKIWNALATGRPVWTSGLALPPTISCHTIDISDTGGLLPTAPPPALPTGIPSWADAWRRLATFATPTSAGLRTAE